MQGRQNLPNTERRGPHKSMHCKFCKPPGVVTPEKSTQPMLETKTKIHLVHEAADLRLYNVHNEPGVPAVESEACICILEGENPCPKCAPDKNRPPPKKKVCRCPKGAKPHPSMYNETAPKKQKPKDEDDEFWWEKYSREHDAIARETWAAYMAQRKKDKKLAKCQKQEQAAVMASRTKGTPVWCQALSCQQMMYIQFLSTAIRLDSDENITDRTHFILGGIGLYPRPKRKILKKCLRFCHYNAIQFLNQLHMLIKDVDPFKEKELPTNQKKNAGESYTWNEKLIMNTMCYLEFPALLRELMERLPPLPRETIPSPIPYPVFPALPKKKYDSPYEEPIWQDRLNWVEKKKIDRINRCRAHLETKRVKIPPLALVRRPSLIDARPPFLAQIEANERASRRTRKEEYKKRARKHPVSTFNSAIDVTAIAGIEASEISTTDKADTDDICVFLREPKASESTAGEMEEEMDFQVEKEVKFKEEPLPKAEESQQTQMKATNLEEENFDEETREDIPFKTPPKTESGATIASPCPPPQTTPGPPATHYERGKRELGIINQELCNFFPFVSSSTHTVKDSCSVPEEDVEIKLKAAADKLKEIVGDEPKKKKLRKKRMKRYKRGRCQKTRARKKRYKDLGNPPVIEYFESTEEEITEKEENIKVEEENNNEMEDILFQKVRTIKKKKSFIRDSEQSDTDPDTDDEWSSRAPCTPEPTQGDDGENSETKRKLRRTKRRRKSSRRKQKKKQGEKIELEEEKGEYLKKKIQKFNGASEEKVEEDKNKREAGEKAVEVFRGDVEALIADIIQDLAEEGFHCAAYPLVIKHPDIEQLILYLKGEILTEKLRNDLRLFTRERWSQMKGLTKFPIAELGISQKKLKKANWNDKNWITKLAKWKTNQFYFKVASGRAVASQQLYETLYQSYFGTERYLKIFYAYMTSKYEDALLRGIV